jgi:DNA-binding beta-propeller fold protein YncE
MQVRSGSIALFLATLTIVALCAAKPSAAPPAPAPATAASKVTAIALPGAPPDGVALDYLAIDRARHRVWVPAGGTGSTDVIDTTTRELRRVEKFPTIEMERRGKKRLVGPSSATVGDGVVYVGNRADSTVCAVDATTLDRGGCVTVPSMPDGLAYVARTKEVWVTTPRDQSIVILDVTAPATPKLAGSFKLDGDPEGFAVDDERGLFYTNLEDKDRTLRIAVATRAVTGTWKPACGEDGPKGLAFETRGQFLVVACPDHVEALAAGADGRILSKIPTGEGVDNLDYLPGQRSLYAAAAGAATLTVARLDEKGALKPLSVSATAKGARNAVVADDGTAYVADGPEGTILVVRPAPPGGSIP